MQLQFGVAKPVAELADLRVVTVIEMLSGAKKLHFRDARLPDLFKPGGGEAMICEDVS
jgi:hypothetical protein